MNGACLSRSRFRTPQHARQWQSWRRGRGPSSPASMRGWRTSKRTIDRSTRFKRDYKRESKGRHRATLDADLLPVLAALATDTPLDPKYRGHDLSGDWAGYRDCHVKPDLVLIYAKPDDETLRLARLGSHSEVFG